MPAYFDGNWVALGATGAGQLGQKQVSFPLQQQTDYYAQEIHREYIASATSYFPIIQNTIAATNHLLFSDDLSQVPWAGTAVVATASATTDTEGGTSATLLAETAATSNHFSSQTAADSINSGALVSLGVELKYAGRQYAAIQIEDHSGGAANMAIVDLLNGVVTATTTNTGVLKSLGGGWYWFQIATVLGATGAPIISIGPNNSPTSYFASYAGTAGIGIYVGRATLVSGMATGFPAIQTTGVTRAVTCPPLDVDPDGNTCDPLSFLTMETAPNTQQLQRNIADWVRTYNRIPKQQVIPTSYLFTAPNYSGSSSGSSGQLPGQLASAASVSGFYAVVSNVFGDSGLINGYFDVAFPATITFKGSAISSLGVTGNNFQPGDALLLQNGVSTSTSITAITPYLCTVLSVSGATVGVVCVQVATTIGFQTVQQIFNAGVYVRRRIQDTPDVGQVVGLVAQNIQDYFLPGYTAGITSFASIPSISPFNINNYFAAVALAYNQGTTWFNVQADPLAYWKGNILVRKYTQAQLIAQPTHGLTAITGTGVFTVPAGITNLRRVLVIGGGGGGGIAGTVGGGGGGGAAIVNYFENIPTTGGATWAVTIGAGGAGGVTAVTNGQTGGTTFFGSYVGPGGGGAVAGSNTIGGAGGNNAHYAGGNGGGGGGGGGAAGSVSTYDGTNGSSASGVAAGAGGQGVIGGGGGGASNGGASALGGVGIFGAGGAGGNAGTSGATPAANSGAGGGGGGFSLTNPGLGAPGGTGYVVVTY